MMRVRIPSGILNSRQVRVLAEVARDYGRGLIDVTTRQAVQYHWLRIENVPDIFRRLNEVGLYTYEACGDCPRNIVGNPLAGIDPYELIDTRPIVAELEKTFLLNKEFSNLPRKYKISVSANIHNAGHAQINDVAFTPAIKEIDGERVVGFHVWVGGGLSNRPHLAQQLDIFVRPEQVVDVAVGITKVFRDYGYREKRHRARLKFLVADWGPEKFLEVLTADLADKYGSGSVRTVNTQNVIITDVPQERVDALLKEPLLERLTPYPKTFVGHAVSCTGKEFCNLALTETKQLMERTVKYLDSRVDLDVPIRLHVNGCPNSCGQQQIADIGLLGGKLKTSAGMVEAYTVSIGGHLNGKGRFNTQLKGRVEANDVPRVLESLVLFYKNERQSGESFSDFVDRVGVAAFQERLDEALAKAGAK
jgi:ferredoxin-nitrite reductase